MQKFLSKMTPRGLYTQFHLTEITYAKVCISIFNRFLPDAESGREAEGSTSGTSLDNSAIVAGTQIPEGKETSWERGSFSESP